MTKKSQKNPKNYLCEKCNFASCNLKDYNRHLATAKHKMMTNDDQQKKKTPKPKFVCECGKEYKYKQILALTILLFFRILDLHSDDKKRQIAFIANAWRLYKVLISTK